MTSIRVCEWNRFDGILSYELNIGYVGLTMSKVLTRTSYDDCEEM